MSMILVAEAAETIAAAPDEAMLARVRAQGVKIPRPAEVRDYLRRYPDVRELTEKVCAQASAEFAGRAELSLELYIDPEIDDPHLTLYVQPDHYDQPIWDKIERLQDGYELELFDLTGWFHLTADFRGPEGR